MTRLGLAAGSIVLASLLAACGSSSSSSEPKEVLAAAPERTLDEKSARASYSLRDDGHPPPPGQEGRAEVSFASREARVSLLNGERYIYTSSHWYLSRPQKDPITGKKWVRFERTKFLTGQDDRLRLIPYLAAGATEASEGEEEEINGFETARYETTVDVERAIETVPEADRTEAKIVLEEALLGSTGRVVFWIDGEGRLRRIRVSVPPGRTYSRNDPNGDSIMLESGPTAQTYTIDYSEFGVEVDANPPPADQVGDYASP